MNLLPQRNSRGIRAENNHDAPLLGASGWLAGAQIARARGGAPYLLWLARGSFVPHHTQGRRGREVGARPRGDHPIVLVLSTTISVARAQRRRIACTRWVRPALSLAGCQRGQHAAGARRRASCTCTVCGSSIAALLSRRGVSTHLGEMRALSESSRAIGDI